MRRDGGMLTESTFEYRWHHEVLRASIRGEPVVEPSEVAECQQNYTDVSIRAI